MKGCINWEL